MIHNDDDGVKAEPFDKQAGIVTVAATDGSEIDTTVV